MMNDSTSSKRICVIFNYEKHHKHTTYRRFIDPLTDFGFKRIFGSEPNKDLLIAFLNELFRGRKVIKDLVYNPQENNAPAQHYRKTIFDLTCTGTDGETFIIEMQRAE